MRNDRRKQLKSLVGVAALFAIALTHNSAALSDPTDPWKAVAFLEGTWDAHAQAGSVGTQSSGAYTFKSELKHHVLVRSSEAYVACKGLASFDCEHSDVLYIYREGDNQPLKAIYFDNEGHVIHYDVSTPDPTTAILISAASASGPQFRLVYVLKDAVMSGKFQIRMPGQSEWKSYLEWSGARK
jgi:hypothetical protein